MLSAICLSDDHHVELMPKNSDNWSEFHVKCTLFNRDLLKFGILVFSGIEHAPKPLDNILEYV